MIDYDGITLPDLEKKIKKEAYHLPDGAQLPKEQMVYTQIMEEMDTYTIGVLDILGLEESRL